MFTDVMVDLETTGTLPDRHAIIQVCAVRFNPTTREVSGDVFDRCMYIPPHRSWMEGTRNFWAQRKDVFRSLEERMEDPATVWPEFCDWAYPAGKARFWSKPSHFDFNFVSSYCHDYEMANPFHFREANDMRSFLRALYFPGDIPREIEDSVEFIGPVHNALYDTFHQIKVLFAHLDDVGR